MLLFSEGTDRFAKGWDGGKTPSATPSLSPSTLPVGGGEDGSVSPLIMLLTRDRVNVCVTLYFYYLCPTRTKGPPCLSCSSSLSPSWRMKSYRLLHWARGFGQRHSSSSADAAPGTDEGDALSGVRQTRSVLGELSDARDGTRGEQSCA